MKSERFYGPGLTARAVRRIEAYAASLRTAALLRRAAVDGDGRVTIWFELESELEAAPFVTPFVLVRLIDGRVSEALKGGLLGEFCSYWGLPEEREQLRERLRTALE